MTSLMLVPLFRILPNPFQTRDGEDPEHVKNLALSIAEQGMLQIPSARIAPGQQGKDAAKEPMVQLVFGHSRLAAYQFLTDSGNEGFQRLPLNIVEMTDEQMFQAAVAENRERKDLTPIEEAKAMLTYKDQFKKNSEEIGRLFHLSDSAVRNKMRLLDLPAEVQSLVGKTLTEGAAREALVFMDLPEAVKQESSWHNGITMSLVEIFNDEVQKGITAEDLNDLVDGAIRGHGERMDRKAWKNTDELVGEGIVGLCKGCEFLFMHNGTEFCMNSACFDAKGIAFRRSYLSQASLLSGIPILDEEKYGYSDHTDFEYGKEAILAELKEKRCENLRLMYDSYSGRESEKATHLVDQGFEHAKIVCDKRNGFCTCLKAKEKGISIQGGEEGVSEADLKTARRQMLQQQRYEQELIKQMTTEAAQKVAKGLREFEFETWKTVLNKLTYTRDFDNAGDIDQVIYALSGLIIQKTTWGGKEEVLRQLNEFLVKCGLNELDISFGEEVKEDEQAREGKTLMEVFSEEEDQD